MKNLTNKLVLLVVAVLVNINAHATHVMGLNISYTNLGGNKYKFTGVMQRDCRGVSLSTIAFQFRCNGGTTTVPATRVSINDITPICSRIAIPCTPNNTYGTGKGYEEHIFEAYVDLDTGFWAQAPWDTACWITVGAGQCCRSGSITTGQANGNFYTEIGFDKCLGKGNNSPTMGVNNIYMIYCQSPFSRYVNNVDEDGDSLTYKLVPQLSNPGTIMTYGQSVNCGKVLSPDEPLSIYQPNPCSYKPTSPNSDPPIGFYFDTLTALCVFVPTNCDELTTISYEVTEHKKDTNGVYHVIGRYRRDFTIHVEKGGFNAAPVVISPKTYVVPAGKTFVASIFVKDDPVILPPPAKIPPPDTVTMTWDSGIANATLLINTTSRLPVGNIAWATKCSDIRQKPYTFRITLNDSACPIPGETQTEIKVKVVGTLPINLGNDRHVCKGTNVLLKANFDYKEVLWSTTDTGSNINVTNPGTYWARAISYCGDTTYDTVKITHYDKPTFGFINQYDICPYDSTLFTVNAPNADSIKWNNTIASDSFYANPQGKYIAKIWDKYCGEFIDSTNIDHIPLPTVTLGPDKHHCKEVNKIIDASSPDITGYLWSNGKKTPTIFVTKPDKYWVLVTNVCGSATDTVDYSDTTLPFTVDLGPDTLLCDQEEITIHSNVIGDQYTWNTFDNKIAITVNQPGEYILRVDKCQQHAFDTINIDFNNTPIIDLGLDQQVDTPFSQILDAGVDNATYLWSTNETNKTITITQQGEYWVKVDNDCGTDTDTINIIANSVIGPNAIAKEIKIYPNPTSQGGVINIDFKDATNQQVKIDLIDLTGKTVYTDETKIGGNTTYSFNPGKLPSGIYFLQLSTPQGKATIRLAVN